VPRLRLIAATLLLTGSACGGPGNAEGDSPSTIADALDAHDALVHPSEAPLADDTCASIAEEGPYCGQSKGLPRGVKGTIYYCRGGQTFTAVACVAGCHESDPGVPDTCAYSGTEVISVNLSEQRLYAYDDASHAQPLFSAPVSTGKPGHDTPAGRFSIHSKAMLVRMTSANDNYDTANVPWDQLITVTQRGGLYIHGAFWSNDPNHPSPNCGHCDAHAPMSHGCINMHVQDARKLYLWSAPGVPVYVGWDGAALRSLMRGR
jgi:hypothetical protein